MEQTRSNDLHAASMLPTLVGHRVSVSDSSETLSRNHFKPQLSINGTLERRGDADEYRVLVSEGTYAYFTPSVVTGIVHRPGHTFQDGAVAVISVRI